MINPICPGSFQQDGFPNLMNLVVNREGLIVAVHMMDLRLPFHRTDHVESAGPFRALHIDLLALGVDAQKFVLA